MKQLVEFKPVFIEEPTNPDDVLGHAAIRKALKPYGVGVATGEAAQNRITFKQLLQAEATDVCQIDAVRLGSVNECLVRPPAFSAQITPRGFWAFVLTRANAFLLTNNRP